MSIRVACGASSKPSLVGAHRIYAAVADDKFGELRQLDQGADTF
jgi:hypothetical protein